MGQAIETLSAFVASCRWRDIPAPVQQHAKLVLLDTLGVMLAGSERPEVIALRQRLAARGRERWPQVSQIDTRYRAGFAYVDAVLPGGDQLSLCRLRYVGSAHHWQVAIYRASHNDYAESIFPSGLPIGTCEDALDLACGLYLNDPTAWHDLRPPTN